MSGAAESFPLDPPQISDRLRMRWRQMCAVFRLSVRLARHGKRRFWVMMLVALLPALMPLAYIVVSMFLPRVPTFPPAMQVFQSLIGSLYIHVVLYVVSLVYGLAMISDEVEGKTLVHLALRPIPRWVIVAGKYCAAWLVAGALLVMSLLVTYALVWYAQETPSAWKGMFHRTNRTVLFQDSLIFLLAVAAYVSFFSCLGAWFRHGERWGVVFCFGWEWLITYLPARLKWLTIKYHVQTLFPHSVEVSRFFSLRGEPLSKGTCIVILLIIVVAFQALTVWNLKRREIQ